MAEKTIYELDGGVGDILLVYNDRVVIQHKGVLNFFAMGLKGDKTIYYSDLTSVQFKKAGWTAGYVQFSIRGGRENLAGVMGATQDENTITINSSVNDLAEKVCNFINSKIKESRSAPAAATASPADELKKFKELLDMGIISQEEFDAKKKQLLGL